MDERVARYIERNEGKYWGKCRGVVVERNDPEQLGRLRLKVPSLFGDADTGWASPASPFAGADIGFFFLPQIGDMVWVEFEEGDLDHPIWSGGFWARVDKQSEIPVEAKAGYPDQGVIKTNGGSVITISDTGGNESITLRTKGCEIVLDATTSKVTIRADEIHIRGSKGVTQGLATRDFVQQVYQKHVHQLGNATTGSPVFPVDVPPPTVQEVTEVLRAE